MVIGLFRAWRNFLLIMYDAASRGRLKPRVISKAIFNLSSNKPCFYYPKKEKKKRPSDGALLCHFLKWIWAPSYVYILSASAHYKICRGIHREWALRLAMYLKALHRQQKYIEPAAGSFVRPLWTLPKEKHKSLAKQRM